MRTYLGIDGGGSKTRFLLIDETGRILAEHAEGSAYHLEIGMPALADLLARGICRILAQAGLDAAALTYAFVGLPAHGEDAALLSELDAAPSSALPAGRFRCGNDMICGWAGALAGADGINIVAGTGSIAYGEFRGRTARAGGWGELFGDEGSAYWIAREGLRLFSRMSDGRVPRGLLHELLRQHLELAADLDLCAAVYGKPLSQRSQLAQLARVVARAAQDGDEAARELFTRAAAELAEIIDAVRLNLRVPGTEALPVSYSGGMFESKALLLAPLAEALRRDGRNYRLMEARLPPDAGAALYAARLAGTPLEPRALEVLSAKAQTPTAG